MGGPIREHLRRNSLNSSAHLSCGSPGKGQEHHAARIGALCDQMRNAMCQRIGLARSSARDDEKWRRILPAMLDGTALFWIERSKVGRGHEAEGVNQRHHQQARLFGYLQIKCQVRLLS